MSVTRPPTLATGKICYLEIPATDVERSAEFYSQAFGWKLRRRGDGEIAFDDTVGEVSGTWVLDRPPSPQPGLTIHIMVADAASTVEAVLGAGGEIVQHIDPDAREKLARFRDPAGNVLGIYQQPGLAETEAEEGRGHAGAQTVAPIPEHLRTVTPRLIVDGAAEAIDFYRRAFGAEEIGERFTAPDGAVIHAELRFGDSIVMLTDEDGDGAPTRSPSSLGGAVSAIVATHWKDVDAVWERAIAAGAEVIYPLEDQFYGERGGRLRDPYGQQWMLSQRIEDLSHEEIAERAARLSGSSD